MNVSMEPILVITMNMLIASTMKGAIHVFANQASLEMENLARQLVFYFVNMG